MQRLISDYKGLMRKIQRKEFTILKCYLEGMCVSGIHLFCSFKTFSIASLTHPEPPLNGEIYFEMLLISATASAGQQAKPQYCITSRSGISSPMYKIDSF